MGTILHIYRVDGETTDEFIDENFTQRFLHFHSEDKSHTILIRAMDFKGKKLDTIKDEDVIVKFMEEISEDIPEDQRHMLGKFLMGEDQNERDKNSQGDS